MTLPDPNHPNPSRTLEPRSLIRRIFIALNEGKVPYGVYKDRDKLNLAACGRSDFNLIVPREQYGELCEILLQFGAIRGKLTPYHDNYQIGRFDWFVPYLSQGLFLHFDICTEVRGGFSYNKVHTLFRYEHISHWESMTVAGASVPTASALDELRIVVARQLLVANTMFCRRHLAIATQPDLAAAAFGAEWQTAQLNYLHLGGGGVTIEVHNRDGVSINKIGVRQFCHAIEASGGFGGIRRQISWGQHLRRRTNYLGQRGLSALAPQLARPRRTPEIGGLIVAVLGVDGAGKSTQTQRLQKLFAAKFDSDTVYLGSGHHRRYPVRNLVRYIYFRFRSGSGEAIKQLPTANTGFKQRLKNRARAVWALWLAHQRRRSVQRAVRMRQSGMFVFCDRWPQAMIAGLMDGPMTSPPNSESDQIYSRLSKSEWNLYREMTAQRPDVVVHLVASHTLSQERKPGELSASAYQRRVALMEQMQEQDKSIIVIQADQGLDAIGLRIFAAVCEKLTGKNKPMT